MEFDHDVESESEEVDTDCDSDTDYNEDNVDAMFGREVYVTLIKDSKIYVVSFL
jgi:hypothetical protein